LKDTSLPGAARRGLLDTMVQGSIVDLFLSCGLAVAPQPRSVLQMATAAGREVSAVISFTSRQGSQEPPRPGRLALSIPEELFALMKLESTRQPQPFDWVRELTNQLAALLKHRLLPFDVEMQPGLPSLVSRAMLEEHQTRTRFPNARTYIARTLRSEIIVTLQCEIDELRLNYAGAVDIASAGDVIVF
jgi:hypothetical protein